MQIKVQCPCGARYSFEVEPVHGRMPMPVNCPTCGADGTEPANAVIQEQLAAGTAAAAEQPGAAARPAEAGGLRLHRAAPATVSDAPPAGPRCAKHPNEPAIEKCRVCGKPICARCMELLGYVCSIYCRNQAESQGIELPVCEFQRSVVEQKFFRRAKWIAVACGLVLAAVAGAWIWYSFIGSHPRLVYSTGISGNGSRTVFQLLAPHDVLSLQNNRLALVDAAARKQVWSTQLNFDPASPPEVMVAADEIWLLWPGRVVEVDRGAGTVKKNLALKSPVAAWSRNGNEVAGVSAGSTGAKSLTRIELASGSVQTEPLKPAAATAASREAGERRSPAESPHAATPAMAANAPAPAGAGVSRDEYFAEGGGVLDVGVRLLEHRVEYREAMKPKTKSYLNNNLTASDSLEASEQELNDLRRQRTGGKIEVDVSRYEVTLRRLPAGAAGAWTGEVIGPPAFFPLRTVDVLAGGSAISVFDKQGKRLWQAKLAYELPTAASDEAGGEPRHSTSPCVEIGNTLYVFDQGMLTAFEPQTGQVRWRLTSVGISSVQADSRGALYVVSTSAGAEKLQFAKQIDIFNRVEPVILKVDPATGKVLWRVAGIANQCYLSGKFVYGARASRDRLAALNPSEKGKVYYNIYRLNPSNGRVLWDYYQPRWPTECEVAGNWILLRFPSELQVLSFLSL